MMNFGIRSGYEGCDFCYTLFGQFNQVEYNKFFIRTHRRTTENDL
jgi:hypothetical protein